MAIVRTSTGAVAFGEVSLRCRLARVPLVRRLALSVAPSAFARFRFPPEVIILAVRWYLRFGLSYRDVEELLAERGIEVDHVTIYRWVQRFTPLLIDAARPCRHAPGVRWFVDETYVKVAGRWVYLGTVALSQRASSLRLKAAKRAPQSRCRTMANRAFVPCR